MDRPTDKWQLCVDFHGHACPGLAIGYRAGEAAMQFLNTSFSADEEVVCVTENDACGVDAIQVLTGCSIGKGNLIYRGTGKQAFSFFNRTTDTAIRVVFKRQLFQEFNDRAAMMHYVLNAPIEELFDIKKPAFCVPVKARLFTSIACQQCGESAPEHKIRIVEGRQVCLDCFPDYSRGWPDGFLL